MGTRGTRFPGRVPSPSFSMRGYCPGNACGLCRQLEALKRQVVHGLVRYNLLRSTIRGSMRGLTTEDALYLLHGASCAAVYAERLLSYLENHGSLQVTGTAGRVLELRQVLADVLSVLRSVAEVVHDGAESDGREGKA